jgi:DUF1016 N-terminal domain
MGSKFIDNLAKDLAEEFPGIKGFSVRNLKNMRRFASEYPDIAFVQVSLAQINWYHHIALRTKVQYYLTMN